MGKGKVNGWREVKDLQRNLGVTIHGQTCVQPLGQLK